MKKLMIFLFATLLLSSMCFAQGTVKKLPVPLKATSVLAENKTIVGTVVSVTVADPAKGIANGTISIVDATGKTASYTVGSVAKVFDATFNAITLNQLKAGDKVKVKGKKTATGKEAQSITLLK